MEKAEKLITEIAKILSLPHNATIMESINAIKAAVELVDKRLQGEYDSGYEQCKKDMAKQRIIRQQRNN